MKVPEIKVSIDDSSVKKVIKYIEKVEAENKKLKEVILHIRDAEYNCVLGMAVTDKELLEYIVKTARKTIEELNE